MSRISAVATLQGRYVYLDHRLIVGSNWSLRSQLEEAICPAEAICPVPNSIETHALPNGLEVEMDDDIVREMVEGQDVGVEVSKVAARSSLVKPEWETVDGEEEIINSATQDDVCTEGYEVRLIF
ncbi:hypothetical protein VE00_10602 [Pseudogymnoascus sp. WSF 3629]|nr:hypothetical protein VE00_10602 [Pseudogymnoascus sp. WSF 3629]